MAVKGTWVRGEEGRLRRYEGEDCKRIVRVVGQM